MPQSDAAGQLSLNGAPIEVDVLIRPAGASMSPACVGGRVKEDGSMCVFACVCNERHLRQLEGHSCSLVT